MTRILVVTGASAGIGAAVARKAAARYAHIVVHYGSDQAGAEAVAADLRAAGAEPLVVQADVSDPAQVAALFDKVAELPAAPLDLVNNAGVVSMTGSLADLTPERVQKVFAVNVFGAIEVARQAVLLMRRWDMRGNIVNISSISSRLGSANQYVDYAASKAAVDTMTIGLADELAAEGIRVNAIRPGLIATELHAKGGEPDRLDRIGHTPPMGRPGSAEEVAASTLWLLSEDASYVTRTLVDVAGGR